MKNVKFLLALLICFFGCSAVSAQTLTVTGKVLDNDGLEAIGATVRIKGNPKVGTITDLDGKYSIQAKPKDIPGFLLYRNGYAGGSGKREKGNRCAVEAG